MIRIKNILTNCVLSLWHFSSVAEGGVIASQDAAEYLFSSDASHPDTLRIHRSLDYLEDRIAVFHACYLTASANSKIKNTVPLGHFLLPPACIQQEIRKKIGSFIWEQMPDHNHLTVQPSQPVEVKYGKEEEEIKKGRKELEISKDTQVSGMLEAGNLVYIPLQNYPVSNMVTGYPSSKEMKKFLGPIHDFIPGCFGYLAYWIPNETNPFLDVKTKLK
uniref:Telomere repeat binding bouquet formation protein 2 n=1 Tax=Salvator merianae TaxID=96440 RepID=A0A8D0BB56_SALMN